MGKAIIFEFFQMVSPTQRSPAAASATRTSHARRFSIPAFSSKPAFRELISLHVHSSENFRRLARQGHGCIEQTIATLSPQLWHLHHHYSQTWHIASRNIIGWF
jgi:hypothetical protein